MAREILFKAKRIDNGEWVEGYPLQHETYWVMFKKGIGIGERIDENTLCQYTGLCDKNGNKIFEGDIISIPFEEDTEPFEMPCVYYEYARVYFDETYHGWYCKFGDDDSLSIWEYDNIGVEVIGNIFDNPELLGGGE